MLNQNDMEWLEDMVSRGEMTADEANVEKVRSQRFMIVTKLPKSVRMVLNNAVKNGELGHKKKDGLLPEVYYHPNFEYLANAERNRIAKDSIDRISKVFR